MEEEALGVSTDNNDNNKDRHGNNDDKDGDAAVAADGEDDKRHRHQSIQITINPSDTVCGASTTYLDLTSAFFFDEEAKDLMMSVCHHCTPAIGILANHAT